MSKIKRLQGIGLLGLCLILGACGDTNVWANAWDVVRAEVLDENAVVITREQIERIPYASIQVVEIKQDNKPIVMVLGHVDGDRLQWIASDNGSFVTRHGRLVRTVGLGDEITGIIADGGDVLSSAPHLLEGVVDYTLSVETYDGVTPRSARLTCRMTPVKEEVIEIASYTYNTRHLVEQCESDVGVETENQFWVDLHTGFVWKSRQQVSAGEFTFEISVLKPFLG